MNPENLKLIKKILVDADPDGINGSGLNAYQECERAGTPFRAIQIKDEILKALREEFLPGYVYQQDCGHCTCDAVRTLKSYYDRWLEANPPNENPLENVHATFPLHEPPIIAKRKYRRK